MCGGAAVGVKRVKMRAQYTALRRARAEVGAGGGVAAHLHPLGAVRQEDLNPKAGGIWDSQN